MTRFLSFVGALLLMLTCALTVHAQTTTTITLSGNVVKHDTSHLVGTYNVVVKVYNDTSGTLEWTSGSIANVNFASPNGMFSFMAAVPNTYFTASPGVYDIEIEVELTNPITLSPRLRLLSGVTGYSNDTFTW